MIQDDRLKIKERFLEYYGKMPVKKYAGYSVGKSEDTIKRWEDEDKDFADRILKLKAEYLLAKSRSLPATMLVPLLFRELTPRTEISGPEGEPIQMSVIQYGTNDPIYHNTIQLPATQAHDSGVERLTPVSSPQLASEGTEDNTSDK